jgi:hypothetical protein
LQYPKYPLQILERLTNFRYSLFNQESEREMLATVLASSFDFYEHRLNLVRHGYSLIICQKHNSVLPLFALEMDTGLMHKPGDKPPVRAPEERKRRTQDERNVFISQIILSTVAGMSELSKMEDPTRRRYLALREQYLQPKVGRPFAS